jgi:hypothetical protein
VAASRRITVSYELVATRLPLKSTVDGPFPRFRELGDAGGGLGGLLDPIRARSSAGADQWDQPLSRGGEIVEAGDAEHGVVDAVASRAAVAEDHPALHPSEGMLVRPQRHQRAEVVGDPVCRGLRDAEQQGHPAHRQVRAPVDRDQAALDPPEAGSRAVPGRPRRPPGQHVPQERLANGPDLITHPRVVHHEVGIDMPLPLMGIGDVRDAPDRLVKRHVLKFQANQFKVVAANPLDLLRPGLPVLNNQRTGNTGQRERRDDRRCEAVSGTDLTQPVPVHALGTGHLLQHERRPQQRRQHGRRNCDQPQSPAHPASH